MQMLRVSTCVLCVSVLLGSASYADIKFEDRTLKASEKQLLSSDLSTFIKNQKIAGLVVAATRNDEVIWADGVGTSSVGSGNPIVRDHHLFRWASVGKVYTDMTARYLSELGALNLDAPITDFYQFSGKMKYYKRCFTSATLLDLFNCKKTYGNESGLSSIRGTCFDVEDFGTVTTTKGFVSDIQDQSSTKGRVAFSDTNGTVKCTANYNISVAELEDNDPQMTVRQLLGHRGGVQHYGFLGKSAVPPENLINNSGAVKYRSEKNISHMAWALPFHTPINPLLTKPGMARSYSTFGYNLVGVAIEKASAMTFQDLMKNLGAKMGAPSFQEDMLGIPPRGGFQRVQTHTLENGKLVTNPYTTDNSYKLAGGGIISNIVDLGRFCAAVATPNFFTTKGIGSYSHSGSHDNRSLSLLSLQTKGAQRQCVVLMANTNHSGVDLGAIRDQVRKRLQAFGYFSK